MYLIFFLGQTTGRKNVRCMKVRSLLVCGLCNYVMIRRSVLFCSDDKFVVWDDLDGIIYRSEIIFA
jgi:hypothetical protein